MGSAKRSLFAAQNIFSTILKFASLQTQNSPFELKNWVCGRFASLRMVNEKILIRAQSFLFQFFSDLYIIIIISFSTFISIQLSALFPFSKDREEFVDLIGVNLHPVVIPFHLFAHDEALEDMFTQGIPYQIALLRQL